MYILGLYKMTIQDNPLPILNDDSLYGLEHSLWELELVNTYLTYVPSRAIRILLKLKVLNLSGMIQAVQLIVYWELFKYILTIILLLLLF